MICLPCRSGARYATDIKRPAEDRESLARSEHARCPEVARHDKANLESDAKAGPDAVTLEDVTLLGSPWCDCQHQMPPRGPVLARA